ncbi:MAG: hypothetical protein UHS41_05530 [Lachnospiraceae bacterium]|nr:hypothetical protein [Lachnospiraceae bacterium]
MRKENSNEAGEILTAIENYVKGISFSVNELKCVPDHRGCFRRGGKWFTYVTDEHAVCMMNGPYNVHGVICASLKSLHAKNTGYQWASEEEQQVYINNHFRSLQEIDVYMETYKKKD